jgi:GNAT superfamily N-acetyltransferase
VNDRTIVIRSDDPRVAELSAAGWTVDARSWGASLDAAQIDQQAYRALLTRPTKSGIELRALSAADVEKVLALDSVTLADYPAGPATAHPALTKDAATPGLNRRGFGAFGASDELLAITYADVTGSCCNVDFTVVTPSHRGRGIATALKAAALLSLAAEGITSFRTGGSSANHAILQANARLGFYRDEEWLTFVEPPPSTLRRAQGTEQKNQGTGLS